MTKNQEEFLKEFKEKYLYLIKDAGAKFKYTIEEDLMVVYCSDLFKEHIDIIEKHFGKKYIIAVGILENSRLIQINQTKF